MNIVDYFIIAMATMVIIPIMTSSRGVVIELISLMSWVGAFIISSHFYPSITKLLIFVDPYYVNWRVTVAVIILFVATLFLGAIITYFLGAQLKNIHVSTLNKVIGSLLGAGRGLLIFTALLYLFILFFDLSPVKTQQSILLPSLISLIDWFFEKILVGFHFS